MLHLQHRNVVTPLKHVSVHPFSSGRELTRNCQFGRVAQKLLERLVGQLTLEFRVVHTQDAVIGYACLHDVEDLLTVLVVLLHHIMRFGGIRIHSNGTNDS